MIEWPPESDEEKEELVRQSLIREDVVEETVETDDDPDEVVTDEVDA